MILKFKFHNKKITIPISVNKISYITKPSKIYSKQNLTIVSHCFKTKENGMKIKRILLKLSGEFLQGEGNVWEADPVENIVEQLVHLHKEHYELGIVIGGGNIFRGGRNSFKFDRCQADTIGMAATCVNALFLQACLQSKGILTIILGANPFGTQILPFDVIQAREYLSQSKVVIFAGGTGHAFFSTDTAAALRASEIQADILLKGTKVDGVYDKDPIKYLDAQRFNQLSYAKAEEGRYGVMDACSFTLCREQKIPIFVFNLNEENAIYKAVHEQIKGTFIK